MVAGRLFSGGNEKRMAADGVTAISELADGVARREPRPDVYHLVADGAAKLGVGWNMPAQVLSDRMGDGWAWPFRRRARFRALPWSIWSGERGNLTRPAC